MAKKKAAKPEAATPAEDAYVEPETKEPMTEAEYAETYPAPETVTAKADVAPMAPAPTGTDIATAVMSLSSGCDAGDYKACAAALKAAQGEFAQMWHKAYS